MTLRGEVDDRIDRMVADQRLHQRGIADVAFDEFNAVDLGEAGAVAGIGEGVEHDKGVAGVAGGPIVHEISADKAGAAGDEEISQALSTPEASPEGCRASAARGRR
jgi:hypothetical protein